MLRLKAASAAWQTPDFDKALAAELKAAGTGHPDLRRALQQGLSRSSHVADAPIGVSLLAAQGAGDRIQVRATILYAGIIAGCSCADDPTPVDSLPEACELVLSIDRRTGETRIELGRD
jgi:hypothetical protein